MKLVSINRLMDKHTKLMLIMLAFKVSRPNCICMLHVIPELANISGLGNELAKVAYICFMCTLEACQLIYEFQLYCGLHQPSSDS
jgi:hypothetical protein